MKSYLDLDKVLAYCILGLETEMWPRIFSRKMRFLEFVDGKAFVGYRLRESLGCRLR